MDNSFGFIHDPLEIKILILYVLARLPLPVPAETLAELVLCDDGITYFDFADCTAELVESGHAELTEEGYVITPKGRNNGKITENSLPYSVRLKADSAVAVVASAQKRSALTGARHALRRKGGYTVSLSLSDGIGPIMQMELYAATEEQAERMEKNFRRSAESSYGRIMEILTGEKGIAT